MKDSKRFFTIALIVLAGILFWHLIDASMPLFAKGLNALMPFFVAFITAYLLRYIVLPVEKLFVKICKGKAHKWQHTIACLIVFIVFLGLVALFIALLVPSVINNLIDVIKNLPQITLSLQELFGGLTQKLSSLLKIDVNAYLSNVLTSFTGSAADGLSDVLFVATGAVSATTGFLLDCVLYIVAAFIMLHSFEKTKKAIKHALNAVVKKQENYEKTRAFLHSCDVIFEKFVVVRLITSVGIGVVSYIGFALFGLPYSLLLALVITVTNLIPYIGPFIGGAPVVLVALVSGDLTLAFWVTIFMLVCQQIEGNILTPIITSDALKVSPLLVLLGIAVFGAMFGIVGMILGAPLIAMIELLFKTIFVNNKNTAEIEETENGIK